MTAVTLGTGGGESSASPAGTDRNSVLALGPRIRRASASPGGRAGGDFLGPGSPRATPSSPRGAAGAGSPAFPSHPAGCRRACSAPPHPRGSPGAWGGGPAAPPSGPAAATLTRSARRGSVLFGRAGPPPPHAAGEAPAPRPRPGRLRPAAPRAAAASWPQASGRAPAGMLPGRRRAGGERAHVPAATGVGARCAGRGRGGGGGGRRGAGPGAPADRPDSSTPRRRRAPRAPAAAAARARRARLAFPHSAAGLRLRQATRGAARPSRGPASARSHPANLATSAPATPEGPGLASTQGDPGSGTQPTTSRPS